MPNLQSPDERQQPLSGSPAPKSSDNQQQTPQQTPQQTTHYQKKDDWPPERLAKLYVIRLQNSKLNWDEFQEKFYPNYHTQVRFKFYEARKLAAKNALPNISPVNLPSNMQPRNRKPRHALEKFYAESELEDSDTDSEGGDILYQTENNSAGPSIANAPHTLTSKPTSRPKPKPASTPSSAPARKALGPTSTAGSEKRPAKRPRISTSSRPATPSIGADSTTTTTNRALKPGSSSAIIDTHHPPASTFASTPIPTLTNFPPHAHPHAYTHSHASAPPPLFTGTPSAPAPAPVTTPIPSNEFGSKIRFDRVNLADWMYIYNLAKACPAERERADSLAMRDQDRLRLIAEMQSRMAEMEAEMEEMRRRVEMQEAAAAVAAAATPSVGLGVGVGGAEKPGQGHGQSQGPGRANQEGQLSSSLSSTLSLLGHDLDSSSMAAAVTQVSMALKLRATELRELFDGLWKTSLKFIPPFQLEEMGMQKASEGIVRKIGEIEGVAEEVGRVRMGIGNRSRGESGSGNESGNKSRNEGIVGGGGDDDDDDDDERRAGSELKGEN